jgi:hypothetical protein
MKNVERQFEYQNFNIYNMQKEFFQKKFEFVSPFKKRAPPDSIDISYNDG